MYCTIRTEKIKDRATATKAIEHNTRKKFADNVDKTRSKWNKCLFDALKVDPLDPSSFQKKLSLKYENLGIKEKKDNVFSMEFILSASPEFFFGHIEGFSREKWDNLNMENLADRETIKEYWKNIDKEKLKDWVKTQEEFAKEEWGESLQRIDLHLDEKTPHMHIIIDTAFKSVKKYKNQKGEFHKETWSLNAKRFNPLYLLQLQDKYALKNAKLGLKRGIQKNEDEEKKKHKKLKDFYEDKAVESFELIDGYEKAQKFEKVFPILKKTILDSFNAITQLIEILETKELTQEENDFIENISKSIPKIEGKKLKNK